MLIYYGFQSRWKICDVLSIINIVSLRFEGKSIQEKGNDTSQAISLDKIQVPIGPFMRAQAKKLREALQLLVHEGQSQKVMPKVIEGLEYDDLKLVHLIQVKEEIDGSVSS